MIGGVTHDFDRADSISLSGQASRVSFTQSDQASYTDFTTTGAWTHSFDPRTTLNTSVTLDWFTADDAAKSERLLWQIMTGLRSQLSGRLTFQGAVGVVLANSFQRATAPATSTTAISLQSGATDGVLANLGFTYQLFRGTTVSITAGESLVPTTLGPLQKITTLGSTLNYDVNHSSSIWIGTQFAHIANDAFVGGASDSASAQIGYGYKLAREWRANMSYTYRVRNDVNGSAQSSTVLVGLVYDFTLMGNPTAFNAAEAARARARAQQAVWQAFPNFQ